MWPCKACKMCLSSPINVKRIKIVLIQDNYSYCHPTAFFATFQQIYQMEIGNEYKNTSIKSKGEMQFWKCANIILGNLYLKLQSQTGIYRYLAGHSIVCMILKHFSSPCLMQHRFCSNLAMNLATIFGTTPNFIESKFCIGLQKIQFIDL